MSGNWVLVSEASRVGLVSSDTIRRWLREGRLRGRQPGGGRGRWMVDGDDLRRLLDEATTRPA